jgi:hypothetical protein
MKQLTRQRNHTDDALVEFEVAATHLEERLDKLGVTEEDLLNAADKVREQMLAEVYGLGMDELVQR